MAEATRGGVRANGLFAETRARLRDARWYGQIVRESRRFALRELSPRASLGIYSLPSSGAAVLVRHGSHDGAAPSDKWPLHEVFRAGAYLPPPAVERELRAAAAPKIVDLGANVGFFGLYVLNRYPNARVVGFEPDAANLEVLRECVRRNGLGERWQVVEACAAARDGTARFVGGSASKSHVASADEREARTVPAVDVLPYLQGAELVKIDVEGSEWEIMRDPRFADAGVRAIVVEYHSVGSPDPNPKRGARALLEGAGFTVEPAAEDDNPEETAFWGRGVLWGWR